MHFISFSSWFLIDLINHVIHLYNVPLLNFYFFFRVISRTVPACEEENPNITCFLMDDDGYVMCHPVLFHPKSPQAPRTNDLPASSQSSSDGVGIGDAAGFHRRLESGEQLHETYLEPALAKDLLRRTEVVSEKSCDRFSDSMTQRLVSTNLPSRPIYVGKRGPSQPAFVKSVISSWGLVNVTLIGAALGFDGL